MLQANGKIAAAALAALLVGSGFGYIPVGRFVVPVKRGGDTPPPPPPSHASSKGQVRCGPLTLEAMLSQGALVRNEDGTVLVDLRIRADDRLDEARARRPIDFALVLDVSGSMADDNKIGLMKQACRGLVSQLGPEDRVAVVSFSTDAQTLFPLERLVHYRDSDADQRYGRAIENLIARGGTNISSGLELGAAELEKSARAGASRRILLLTDGQPNQGDPTPEGLRGICTRLYRQGISVTTVGLGLDYNAQLLSGMAEAGGGSYHYVDAPSRIAGIYDAELRSLRALVARNVRLTLEPRAGAQVLDLVEWAPERQGSSVSVNVGDIESGRTAKVVARLRVRTNDPSSGLEVLGVRIAGEIVDQPAPRETALVLGVQLTDRPEVARASETVEARKDLEDAKVASLLETARRCAERGDRDGARTRLAELRRIREKVTYDAADKKVMSMDVDELQKAYESNDSERRARADIFSKTAAGAAAK